ncbi:hypothetical protein BDN72DRAFT_552219 [Pluteus cervinus]|uniref:Uncharacterized protein n=1 Tax=Pluteus cervinus TaxID=181527 RepID=A0ACD3AX29_9AGAR|nr:hypothetical protein BDN72DRAFT_552219 [Pluteus cervinus]
MPDSSIPTTELPFEILSSIIHLSTSDLSTSLRSYSCDGDLEWELYNRALRQCAQFRLVDSTWNAVATPTLYSIVVLPAWPLEKSVRCAKAVDYHPEMITALIVTGCSNHQPLDADERQIFGILCSSIGRCTSIDTLYVHLGGNPPQLESRAEELFGSVQSDRLTSLAIFYPKIETITRAISGLGTRSSQLEELVLYGVQWDGTPTEFLHLPSLISLTVHWEWPPGLNCTPFAQFFSILVLGGGDDSPSPLRDLTISGILDLDVFHITALLSSHKIGISLTSLQVNLPPSLEKSTVFETLPNTILSLCPALTRFLYFAWCPVSLLYSLPPRLQEFGVTIVHIAGPGAALLLTTVTPLIELVQEPLHRKGIQKLYIQWALYQPAGAEKKLEDACIAAGIEFSSVETSIVSGARPKVFHTIPVV